jgi:aldose 1-epimerase
MRGDNTEVVLGLDVLKDYEDPTKNFSFGCVVGRYANRIVRGRSALDGVEYQPNDPPHGGYENFGRRVWKASAVEMTHKSRDGEGGFPGNLIVVYTLTRDSLRIDYEAAMDKTTVINLTNHTYWNLHSHENGTILDHVLEINASNYTPADQTQIPTGR